MRNAALVPLVLAALAACADQPVATESPAEDLEIVSAGTTVSTVSQPRTIGWNEGGWATANLPYPEAGGGRVVWQDRSGPTVVRAYDFGTGAQSQVAMVNAEDAEASTAGRWVAWSDENWTIHLRDMSTGQTRAAGTGFTPRVSAQGRVAYVSYVRPDGRDARNRNVSVYDAATGATRVLTQYTDAGGQEARAPVTDGDLVVWMQGAVWPNTISTLRMFNLATGEERELLRTDRLIFIAPEVSQGRIVWTERNPDQSQFVVVYDVATGQKRRITGPEARPLAFPRISGGLVVWEDSRNYSATNRLPESDIFAYDLASGTEMAIATGPNHQGWPSVDGGRVVWTELVNERWEIRAATLETVSLQTLGAALEEMLAAGQITNRGTAQSLRSFLAQASRAHQAGDAAGERAALQRFRAHVQQHAGKQVSADAAARLTAMADAVLAALGG